VYVLDSIDVVFLSCASTSKQMGWLFWPGKRKAAAWFAAAIFFLTLSFYYRRLRGWVCQRYSLCFVGFRVVLA
jgi:hypothetical protein